MVLDVARLHRGASRPASVSCWAAAGGRPRAARAFDPPPPATVRGRVRKRSVAFTASRLARADTSRRCDPRRWGNGPALPAGDRCAKRPKARDRAAAGVPSVLRARPGNPAQRSPSLGPRLGTAGRDGGARPLRLIARRLRLRHRVDDAPSLRRGAAGSGQCPVDGRPRPSGGHTLRPGYASGGRRPAAAGPRSTRWGRCAGRPRRPHECRHRSAQCHRQRRHVVEGRGSTRAWRRSGGAGGAEPQQPAAVLLQLASKAPVTAEAPPAQPR